MDDATPSSDWASQLQQRFLSDLARFESSPGLAPEELACLQQVVAAQPKDVYRLLLAAEGGPSADLAGFFMLFQVSNKALGVYMFSPVAGLERFASRQALRGALEQRLATGGAREDILRFVPVELRESLTRGRPLRLRRLSIEAPVFENRRQSIIELRQHNLELMRERLLGLPSLRALLDEQLKLQLDHEFQGLDLAPQSTRVNSYVDGRRVSGMTLGDAALRYMAQGGWPQGTVREYVSPTVPYVTAQAQSSSLDARMQALVRLAVQTTQGAINPRILGFWALKTEGLSLRELARQVMGDRFFNALLQARHQGRIDPVQFAQLKRLCNAGPSSDQLQAGPWHPGRISLLEQDNAEVQLAGLFNAYLPGARAEMFLFSERAALEGFGSRTAFKEGVLGRLQDPRHISSLLPHVSGDQQVVLRNMRNVILEVEMIDGDLFDACVQSIIDKQLRDLRFLLSAVQGTELDVNAVVDHALDVRRLLDPRLMQISSQGRWSTGLALEHEPTPALMAAPDTPTLALIRRKLTELQEQMARMVLARPTPSVFAQQRLGEQLATFGVADALPRQWVVQTYASYSLRKSPNPLTVTPLADALLERVTGCNPLPADGGYIRVGVQKNSAEIKPVERLDGATVLSALERAAAGWVQGFSQHLHRFYTAPSEPLSGFSVEVGLSRLRGSVLRHEVQVKRFEERLHSIDAQMINTALDRPLRDQRRALNGFIPDVCELSLWFPDQQRSVNLNNSFLITERGGTDADNCGRVVAWTASHGIEGFAALGECLQTLSQRVLANSGQWALQSSIHLGERSILQEAAQAGSTPAQCLPTVIEGHWLEICQRRVTQMNLRDIDFILEQGVAHHLCAPSLINQVASYWSDQAGFKVDYILDDVRDQLFEQGLPDWLKHARPEARAEYADLMLRFRQAGVADEHYSEGVPELLEYARGQLQARLQADFLGMAPGPDEIEISVVEYSGPAGGEIAGPAAVSRLTHSLTYFALSNFFNVQSGTRQYRSLGAQPLPAGLDDHYVRGLVRSLDLAARYEALLIEKLTPGHAGVARRQELFAQQLPAQLLEFALQASLKGELSEKAYACLKHVLDSPDAEARERYQGVELVIRPLAFRAIEGRHPDIAQGMYWIGPAALDAGPQLLYVLYHKGWQLKEYAHQSDFLAQLHATPLLQNQVLERLAPRARKIYAHNGFFEPHIGYVDPTLSTAEQANPPATLAGEVIAGNLLSRLYADTLQVRLAQVRTQAHSVSQADWASLEYLLSLLADMALLILPGKLSVPLMVRQAQASLQAALEATVEDHWGEALFDFANALLMLESARIPLGRGAKAVREAEAIKSATRVLSREQRNGLRPYAANQVSLRDLHTDLTSGFYSDLVTGYQYIDLDGQVFRVVPWQAKWRIYIGEGRDGPLVRRDPQQRWGLDLKEPLQGGGQVLRGLSAELPPGPSATDRTLTALGMRTIERLHPQKAQIIREAHAQAIGYVTDCLEHLQFVNDASELSEETRRFLRRIFSVRTISKSVLDKLKRACDQLLATLLAPEYSPLHSKRYALFSPPDQRSVAMVSKVGSVFRHKTVFLGDQYFANADDFFAFPVIGRDGREFDRAKHSAAAILLHEFSHIAHDSVDINYLGVRYPFEELLVPETAPGMDILKLKRQMQDNRYRQLTLETPEHELFKEKYTNQRAYLPLNPRLVYTLLKRTRCKTIEELRTKFVSDPVFRADVVLMNADSLALLITWLGYFKPPSSYPV